MESTNTQGSVVQAIPQETPPYVTHFKMDVSRLLRRKMISQTRATSLSSLKRQVRKRESDLGVRETVNSLAAGELIIDPNMALAAELLSDNLRERFPEVEAVVLLGSSVHGGAKIREGTGNKEPDLDWGVITNRYIDPTVAKEINEYAGQFKGDLINQLGLDEDFHMCVTANPIQYRGLNLSNPEQVVELFRLRKMPGKDGKLPEDIQLLPGRQAVLYLQPSFPPEVNERNREILLEGLKLLGERWPSLWENSIYEIMVAWNASHKLKPKHFSTVGRPRDKELVRRVTEESSSGIMGRSLENLLWSTGDSIVESEPEESSDDYETLIELIQLNPRDEKLWERVVELARKEEGLGNVAESSENYYSKIPLEELIKFGDVLRKTPSKSEQYLLLTQRCSTGERWYDILLGHLNDKMFAPIVEDLESIPKVEGFKWELGLDIGTGTGNTLRAIAPYFKKVIGVDKEGPVLEKIKDEGDLPSNAEVVLGDATNLPLGDEQVDIAVSNGLSHYLSKDEHLHYISEIARVMTLGGTYYESFVEKNEGDLLPKFELGYLSSAKGVLVCLMDNLVSHQNDSQARLNGNEMVEAFRSHGFSFSYSRPNSEGIWYMRFQQVQ